MKPENTLRIGTRGSLLARTQTENVAQCLRNLHPRLVIETVIIQTTGDARQNVPFAAVGTKGMFVKEIEQALLEGTIDLAVHSLKDMPSELPEGLALVCVPPREDPRDALLTHKGASLDDLPHAAIVGTSSLRRQAQLLAYRPDLKLHELRGNLDTRLRKLDAGDYDAIVLACAGLNRLGLAERITQPLPPEICLPAVGQGALALEARTQDSDLHALLAPLHHIETSDAITAERAFLARLEGGCTIPAGAYATLFEGTIVLNAVIASPNGSQIRRVQEAAPRAQAVALGKSVAERLLAEGGESLLKG